MAELPRGTVTFLLTDVEGSTALWEQAPEVMRRASLDMMLSSRGPWRPTNP